jgi:hypothetical protein
MLLLVGWANACAVEFVLTLLWKYFQDLSTGWLSCDPGPMFKPEHYFLGDWVPLWVRTKKMCLFQFVV